MKASTIIRLAALGSLILTPTIFYIIIQLTGLTWLWWVMLACLVIDSITFLMFLPMAAATDRGLQISLPDVVRMRLKGVPHERVFEAMALMRDAGREISPDQLITAAGKGLDPVDVVQQYLKQQGT